MGNYEKQVTSLREEILLLRQLEYPWDVSDQNQEINPQLIKLRYITIDSACAALQGSSEWVELLPALEIREQIEKDYLPSLENHNAKLAAHNMLQKIDELRKKTKEFLTAADRIDAVHAQISLAQLTETIYKAQGQLDAESMHLFLESYGFRNKILQESAGIVLALTVGKLGEAEIRVTPEDSEQAKKYIQAMKANVFMLSELEEMHLQSLLPEENAIEGWETDLGLHDL